MSNVFVVDTMQKPLDPVHPGRARMLVSSGKAAVFRRFPFTIILKQEVHEPVPPPYGSSSTQAQRPQGLPLSTMHQVRSSGRLS